ncbi:LysR family transcriptional regulator [Acinetobacter puyangensis]|uniref:DNA-binding transcriptional regulator, LysR family n=1 Tax=Acinetobacter puyangensis TaxID=1096779 RepID=A0A240EDU8_9GAMM|nr:LysR family transcriptional regulator [Acinetobacter puyangensis]SNX46872.1 DNA-binding transcriptional regulator, LysR family [Acinetobacter puyangensis]
MDLGLIKVFVCIYESRNIGKAADKLNLSQPSVTYNLNRLRDQLNDVLFIRRRSGVEPTKMAHELYPIFHQAIFNIESAIAEVQAFHPETSHKTFRIGLSDVGEICLLPSLIAFLQQAAPNIKIEIEEIESAKVEQWLIDGFLDLAVFNSSKTMMSKIETRTVFEERYVCISRANHPRLKKELSLEQYLQEDHIAIKSSTGHIQVEQTLKTMNLKRHIRLEVPHFSVLQGVLQCSDMLVTLPSRAAQNYLKHSNNVQMFELPFAMDSFKVSLNWFNRSDDIVARKWLAQSVWQIFQCL